jgi:hypothetical protein
MDYVLSCVNASACDNINLDAHRTTIFNNVTTLTHYLLSAVVTITPLYSIFMWIGWSMM